MDKIELVKQKIEELKSKLIHGACSSQTTMETHCKEEAYDEVLAILDTMQEEPSKFDDAIQEGDDVRYNEDLGCKVNLFQLKSMAKKEEPKWRVGDIIRQGDTTAKIIEISEDGYHCDNAFVPFTTQGQWKLAGFIEIPLGAKDSKLMEATYYIPEGYYAVVEGNKVVIKKGIEPVSEDLEEAINAYIGYAPEVDECSSVYGKRQAFKAGAQWQEKQDQETIEVAEDHAMLAGMEKMKEEMTAKAIDGYVIEDIEEGNGDFLLSADYLPKSMGLKDQQRVKVIVIKED